MSDDESVRYVPLALGKPVEVEDSAGWGTPCALRWRRAAADPYRTPRHQIIRPFRNAVQPQSAVGTEVSELWTQCGASTAAAATITPVEGCVETEVDGEADSPGTASDDEDPAYFPSFKIVGRGGLAAAAAATKRPGPQATHSVAAATSTARSRSQKATTAVPSTAGSTVATHGKKQSALEKLLKRDLSQIAASQGSQQAHDEGARPTKKVKRDVNPPVNSCTVSDVSSATCGTEFTFTAAPSVHPTLFFDADADLLGDGSAYSPAARGAEPRTAEEEGSPVASWSPTTTVCTVQEVQSGPSLFFAGDESEIGGTATSRAASRPSDLCTVTAATRGDAISSLNLQSTPAVTTHTDTMSYVPTPTDDTSSVVATKTATTVSGVASYIPSPSLLGITPRAEGRDEGATSSTSVVGGASYAAPSSWAGVSPPGGTSLATGAPVGTVTAASRSRPAKSAAKSCLTTKTGKSVMSSYMPSPGLLGVDADLATPAPLQPPPASLAPKRSSKPAAPPRTPLAPQPSNTLTGLPSVRKPSVAPFATPAASVASYAPPAHPVLQVGFTPARMGVPLEGPTGAFRSTQEPFVSDSEAQSWEDRKREWVPAFNEYIKQIDEVEL